MNLIRRREMVAGSGEVNSVVRNEVYVSARLWWAIHTFPYVNPFLIFSRISLLPGRSGVVGNLP